MDKSYRLTAVVVVASAIAAMAFSMQASANPFARLGGQPLAGYGPPTDNGNEVRPDLRRRLAADPGDRELRTALAHARNQVRYADPEMRLTQAGLAVCNLSVATSETQKDKGEVTEVRRPGLD
jgi:hypothetical protein